MLCDATMLKKNNEWRPTEECWRPRSRVLDPQRYMEKGGSTQERRLRSCGATSRLQH